MGQRTSSSGPMDVSRGPCPRPLGASALSPAGLSCSRLDPSSRLWVSGLEPAAAEGSGARSPPSALPSPASPSGGLPSRVAARLQPASE